MLESIVTASKHPFQIDGAELQHSMPGGNKAICEEASSQMAHMDLRHLLQVRLSTGCCCQSRGPHDWLNVGTCSIRTCSSISAEQVASSFTS